MPFKAGEASVSVVIVLESSLTVEEIFSGNIRDEKEFRSREKSGEESRLNLEQILADFVFNRFGATLAGVVADDGEINLLSATARQIT